jgi:hypothetical protein
LTPVYESRLDGTIVAVRNAPDAEIPTTPAHFFVEFKSACRQHGWFGKGEMYPGRITY